MKKRADRGWMIPVFSTDEELVAKYIGKTESNEGNYNHLSDKSIKKQAFPLSKYSEQIDSEVE